MDERLCPRGSPRCVAIQNNSSPSNDSRPALRQAEQKVATFAVFVMTNITTPTPPYTKPLSG
jgi:hypothetical protein